MAISASQIATTNTLEQFRVQFNNLQTDVNGLESGTLTFSSVSATTTSTSSLNILQNGTVVFEGSTNDDNETTLTVADPSADRTITLPDATGTVFLTNTTDTAVFTDKTQLSSGDVAGGTDVLLIADANVTTLKKITVDDLISSAGGLTPLAGDSTPQLGGDLDVNGNKITSASNANVEIEPNGTGDILLDADLITLGSGTEVGHLSTPGAQDIKLSTNSGTDSGTLVITDGANGNITLTPNGTGDVALAADTVVVGDSNADATITSNGTGNLILNTNSGTASSALTIVDAANGDIQATLNGTGVFQIDGSDGVEIESGSVSIKNGGTQSKILFYCESSNAHYVQLQAPAHANFAGNEIVTLPNNTGELDLRDAIILDASDSGVDVGADLLQNTAANENDRILLEDAMTGDTGGFLSGHDFTFTGSDITVGGSFGIPIDKGFTLGGSTKWTIECSSADNDLDIKFNGATVLKIASNGALTSNNDLTAFGTP